MSEAPKIYEPEYYRLLNEQEVRHWWSFGMRDVAGALLDSSIPASPLRILDAGCGTGVFLDWLQRYRGSRIFGIDISEHALRYCSQRGKTLLARASVRQLPFRSGSFDLITCNDVLQHVASGDSQILTEFERLLNPGGHVYVRTNAEQRWAPKSDPANDYIRYSLPEITAKAQMAGFEIIRATHANAFPSLLGDLRNYRASKQQHHHHEEEHSHAYTGLKFHAPPMGVNSILRMYLRWEAGYLSKQGRKLSFGHSLHLLLRKPAAG